MLGSPCNPCCKSPCNCGQGELPPSVTVTFTGLPTEEVPGPPLLAIGFSSCFGSGATAHPTGPGGDPNTDKGPISGVNVSNGGSGYAVLGRTTPTLTVSSPSGSGAVFSVTLAQTNNECGIPTWSVQSVAVSEGEDYSDETALVIEAAEGDMVVAPASAILRTERGEPEISVSVEGGGSGAVLVPLLSKSGNAWTVSEITIDDGGTGYTDGSALVFTIAGDDVATDAAFGTITTSRIEPEVTLQVNSSTGSGAVLTAVLAKVTDGPIDGDAWVVVDATIVDGGEDYLPGDPISATVVGTAFGAISLEVQSTFGANGAIASVTVFSGGAQYKDGGVITSLDFYGGTYFKDVGVPLSVEVTNGGTYYREDDSLQPYVANVTAVVGSQWFPFDGSGAEFAVQVDDDVESSTFGQIVAVNVVEGGNDYLAWEWVPESPCAGFFEARAFVLEQVAPSSCYYQRIGCAYDIWVQIDASGGSRAWMGPGSAVGNVAFASLSTTDETIEECSEISLSLENENGVTVSVQAGGDFDGEAVPSVPCPASATLTFRGTTQGGDLQPRPPGPPIYGPVDAEVNANSVFCCGKFDPMLFSIPVACGNCTKVVASLVEAESEVLDPDWQVLLVTGLSNDDQIFIAVGYSAPCSYSAQAEVREWLAQANGVTVRRVTEWESDTKYLNEQNHALGGSWPDAASLKWKVTSISLNIYTNDFAFYGIPVDVITGAYPEVDGFGKEIFGLAPDPLPTVSELLTDAGADESFYPGETPDITWSIEWPEAVAP